jgi:hypothetical protein
MEAARTSETSVDNHFTRQYNPEDSSEHHTRRRENLKSHKLLITPKRLLQVSYQTCGYNKEIDFILKITINPRDFCEI